MRWITLKSWLAAAAFLGAMVFAPAVMAHDAHHQQHHPVAAPAANDAAQAGSQDVHRDVHAAQPATELGGAQDCPEDRGSPHSGHPGCCAGIGHCAGGCGTALIVDMAAFPVLNRNLGSGDEPLLAPGIVSDPTDRPPRTSV
jgi:hypothetical protein